MARVMTADLEKLRVRRQATFGWPAIVFVILTAAATIFSFSPRPVPSFPPSVIHVDRLLINGLAASGRRLIAAGEQGHILIADSPTGPWREASIAHPRGSSLTQVAFIDDKTAIAVGHDNWILRSDDRGETWKEMAFDGEQGNALLGIAGPYSGRLFAFGGFGELRSSDDQGRSWQKISLDDAKAAKSTVPAKPADPNAFPFSDSAVSADEDRHIYGITACSDGSLILAGERGLLMRSHDNGDHWQSLPSIYAGSFFGILSLKNNALLVYGMRGNVFRSGDAGAHWTKIAVPTDLSLFGGAVTLAGEVLLVGDAATVLESHDAGASFTRVAAEGRKAFSTILPLDNTHWLTGGDGGINLIAGDAGGAHR